MQQHDIFQVQSVQKIVKKIQTLMYDEVWDLQELEEQMRRHVLALGEILMGVRHWQDVMLNYAHRIVQDVAVGCTSGNVLAQ
jgi:hypothetical protein